MPHPVGRIDPGLLQLIPGYSVIDENSCHPSATPILSVTINHGGQDGRSASEARPGQAEDRHGARRCGSSGGLRTTEARSGNHPGDCARPAGADGRGDPPISGQTDAGGDARQPDPDRQLKEGRGNLDCVTDGKLAIAVIGSCQVVRFLH